MRQFLYDWQTLIAGCFALLGGFAIFQQTSDQRKRDAEERTRKRRAITVVFKAEVIGIATRLSANLKVFERGLVQKDIRSLTILRIRIPPLFDNYLELGFDPTPEIAGAISVLALRLRLFEMAIDEMLIRVPNKSELNEAVSRLATHSKEMHQSAIDLNGLLEGIK